MRVRPAIIYSVLRILFFAVPFALMMLLPPLREFAWLAAIFAALIGVSLSVIFLRKPLAEATEGLGTRRASTRRPASDEVTEDSVIDESQQQR